MDLASPQPTPKRRWPRFRLRTLFMVATVVAIIGWVGYNLNWIRQRHQLVAEQLMLSERYQAGWAMVPYSPGQPPTAPGLLWLFGEAGLPSMTLLITQDEPGTHDADEQTRLAKRLFPESRIAIELYSVK
jgi:hypothetical protein